MILLLIPLAAVAVFVGVEFGWRFVLAPLLGLAFYRWATAMLRSMVHDGQSRPAAADQAPRPVAETETVLYWCGECGTELLLLVEGSGTPPRHCMEKMHERAEIPSG